MIDHFVEFYINLNSGGLILFWGVIFVFFLLLFLTIALAMKNRELTEMLKKEQQAQQKDNLNKLDPVSNTKETTPIEIPLAEPISKEVEVKTVQEINQEPTTSPYQRNLLKEMERRDQTSPIHIIRKTDDAININELEKTNNIKKEESDYDDEYYDQINDGNISFVDEVSKQLDEEIKPHNIELTDYEQKQEDEAIISYQELLQVKDKLYNITDDEEIDDFIDNLKDFRDNLK